jgi:anti-sigma B factor antagonist
VTLDVHTETDGELTVVTLGGELDIYSAAVFRSELEGLATDRGVVAVDLRDVTLLDSSGLASLVSLLNRVRGAHGRMGLICPHQRLRRVFDITGLRREFVFADDLPTLRAALTGASDQE